MTRRRYSGSKIDRVRRHLLDEDVQVLNDPYASQEDKTEALANLEAKKRLKPDVSDADVRIGQNGMYNTIEPGFSTIEDDMARRVTSAHGHTTNPAGFERFSQTTIQTDPLVYQRVGNRTNFGYPSETGERARKSAQVLSVSQYLEKTMKKEDFNYSLHVAENLQRQWDMGGTNPRTLFERFERQVPDVSQEQLYVVAHSMKLISEKFDSTAGKWVVTMPWSDPKSAEQILYNQRGMSNVTTETLKQHQRGQYHLNVPQKFYQMTTPQLPPSKPNGSAGNVEYYASRDKQESQTRESLKNPKRGDDYIRWSRVRKEELEQQKWNAVEKHLNKMETLSEQIKNCTVKYRRENLRRELKGVKNSLVATKAIFNEEIAKALVPDPGRAVNAYSSGLTNMYENSRHKESSAESAAYSRHLSLLEEANKVLSMGQPKQLGY